jgi:hypothetical protein
MDFCKYKDYFGAPNTGAHQYRIFDFAIVDVVFTIIAGYLIAKLFNMSIWNTIIALFLLGILMHRLYCVRTTIDKLLFV